VEMGSRMDGNRVSSPDRRGHPAVFHKGTVMFRRLKAYFGKKSAELTLKYMISHIERNRSEFARLIEEIKEAP
jgi:hypothetical protein